MSNIHRKIMSMTCQCHCVGDDVTDLSVNGSTVLSHDIPLKSIEWYRIDPVHCIKRFQT